MLFNIFLDILIFLNFSGVFLQNIDDCSSNPCKNGGTCDIQQDGYTCECAGGWTGNHCQEKQMYDPGHISRKLLSTLDSYSCDNNWVLDRSSCFFIGEEAITWSSADAECQELGGYLAEVSDATENAALVQQSQNFGRSLWIGLSDADIEGTWVWKNSSTIAWVDGNSLAYTNWYGSEPNDYKGREDCALYSPSHASQWNDKPCYYEYSYICEKAANDVDECTEGNHNCDQNAECENEIGTFNCTCNAGFYGDGHTCTEIDECGSNPCENGATCLNLVNNYNCTCQPGFEGIDCETDTDECASNPCQNGASCLDNVNNYTCVCTNQFTGTICETDMCRPQHPTGADVVFLIDVSFSQSFTNFEKEKQFVKDFVSKFPIGQEDFQVALVTSSIYATVHFYLSNFTIATNITEAIDDLVYEEGPTFTGKGLQKIRENVLHTDNGARDDVSKYVIVLTDGLSSDRQETKSQADLLKSTGVEVFSVAVGRQMYHQELIDIASHWTRVFPVSSSDVVNAIFNAHVMVECQECYHSKSDVALMIDASNEISLVKYYKEIEALNVLLKKMTVGDDGVHVSCSQYAQDVEEEFHFTDFMMSSDIIVKMNKLEQLSSAANVTRALEHLRKFSFLNSWGARNGTRKLALLVLNANVSGESDQDIISEAERLKDSVLLW